MDQKKIGSFLRELRTEKSLTQEQLAEKLGVASRTVSRWENGNNMPDLSIMVELADFYDVDIRELLNGERKSEIMNKDLKETLEMVSEYTATEKKTITKELSIYIIGSAIFFGFLFIISFFQLERLNDCFQTMSYYFGMLGLIYSIGGIVKLYQLTDKISKTSFKKIKIITIILAVTFGIIVILTMLFTMGVI